MRPKLWHKYDGSLFTHFICSFDNNLEIVLQQKTFISIKKFVNSSNSEL